MGVSEKAAELGRRHPLQRFEAPSKGFSGALHVRYIPALPRTKLELTILKGCWSYQLLQFLQVVGQSLENCLNYTDVTQSA